MSRASSPRVLLHVRADGENEALTNRFRSEGFDVFECKGSVVAVMAKASLPDIVVLDGSLPEVGALLTQLRSEPITEGLPVIVRSAATNALFPAATAVVDDAAPEELVVRARALLLQRDPSPVSVLKGPASGARRVLLVDDNVDACSLFEMVLEGEGHVVHTAFDGPVGLAQLISGNYDVAVIDIGLPGIDGYELARRAREVLAERTPLLVAMTGYGRESDRAASRAAGFGVHLVKPVDVRVLVSTLQKELAARVSA